MKRMLIGHVAVDSGQLLIIDPAYEGEDLEAHPDKPNQLVVARHQNDAAVAFNTEIGDGYFPVYAYRNDQGELSSITISLVEESAAPTLIERTRA